MGAKSFTLTTEYIELIKLLKLLHIASSGAAAKFMVEDGLVSLNGKIEGRKRAKIRCGDSVEVMGLKISIEQKEAK